MNDSDVDDAIDGNPHAESNVETAPASAPLAASNDLDEVSAEVSIDSRRRRPDWGFLIASFVIAAGLVAIVWGVSSAVTGQDGIDRPAAIESISPVENAQQVVQQEQVVVDLQFGYEAALIIDGIELETTRIGETTGDLTPSGGRQVTIPPTAAFDPGNSRIEFRPSDDAAITSYAEGRHSVQVIFWPFDEDRETGAKSYSWSFDVI